MILVYLPNRSTFSAMQAAQAVEKHIKGEEKLVCPICTSEDFYFSRKSRCGSRWMEIEGKCGGCGTRFGLPDKALQGFWRGSAENKQLDELMVASEIGEGELVEMMA